MMLRLTALALAALSLFLFPWPVSLALMLLASLLFPPAGPLLGVLGDVLYFMPGSAPAPYFLLWGLVCFGIALLVQRFVKTRIIGE